MKRLVNWLIRKYKNYHLLRIVEKLRRNEVQSVKYIPSGIVGIQDNYLKKRYGLRKRSESEHYMKNFVKG